MRTRKWSLSSLGLVGILLASNPTWAANERTTIILHASAETFNCVQGPFPFDCLPGSGPIVSVAPGDEVVVSVFLRNYDSIDGVHCRFAVDGASGANTWGDWSIVPFSSTFSCLAGQTASEMPNVWDPQYPYHEPGNLSTTFLCLESGLLRALGRVLFTAGTRGCLGIEEYPDSYGTVVSTCTGGTTPIQPLNRGRICVGEPGYNACNPIVPVEAETWGRIKSTYRY